MDFFELKAAMHSKEPVMTKLISGGHTSVVVGRVVGVTHRLDPNDKEIVQVELMERGKNSITVVAADKVDRVWEVARPRG